MLKKIVTFSFMLLLSLQSYAFPSGSGTCGIDKDYLSITGMTNRFRNFNRGTYTLTANTATYLSGEPVEITLAGADQFIGILFAVIDEFGNTVGSFNSDVTEIQQCFADFMVVTHTSNFSNTNSYTMFWMPPATSVGRVYVIGYVLKGTRGVINSQEFFRFVRDDDSALSIASNAIFNNGFE